MPQALNMQNVTRVQVENQLPAARRALATGASVEIAPRDIAATPQLSSALSATRQVYVPFLPRAEFAQTIHACRMLVSQGYEAIAHLPARAVASRLQLSDWLTALSATGVDSILLIAGDRLSPAGEFNNTLEILESGILAEHGIRRVGVAGHPTGHPVADPVMLDHALRIKSEYARATGTDMWIVSQFAFGSTEILAWMERLRGKDFGLPVRVGIPGPSNLRKLIAFAAQCGVEASTRVLSRRPGAARLLSRWSPDALFNDLARYQVTHPDSPFVGVHVFTFGGFEQSASWLQGFSPSGVEAHELETAGAA